VATLRRPTDSRLFALNLWSRYSEVQRCYSSPRATLHRRVFLTGTASVFRMIQLSFDELHDALKFGGESLALRVPPVVFVDLTSNPHLFEAPPSSSVVDGSLCVPCVVVGIGDHLRLAHIGRATELVDVVVACVDDAAEIVAALARSPLASVALVLLLRGRDRRSVDESLVAESVTYSMLQSGPEFAAWRSSYPSARLAGSDMSYKSDVSASSAPLDSSKSLLGSEAEPVLVSRSAKALCVTLHRPARHNAYSVAMRDGLVAALELAVVDEDLHVVLKGNGPSFCSGGELTEFGSFADPASAHQIRLTRSAARQLVRISGRVTVSVHGYCLGAGIELAAFASRVIAHPETLFALPELALGLVPGSGGTASLPPRIGRHRTTFLALTGRRINAATALDWGLIDEVGPE
jgi:Enoyl-CoA hydratase/isomerase